MAARSRSAPSWSGSHPRTVFRDQRERVLATLIGYLRDFDLAEEATQEAFRDGDLVLLADQDPTLWDTAQLAKGRAVLDRGLALGGRGPYVLQAAIASLHAEERRDWPQIAALYGELARLTGSPIVELNRAVAVAEVQGPEAGPDIVDRLGLDDYHYLHSTRGELLRRLGRLEDGRDPLPTSLSQSRSYSPERVTETRGCTAALDGRSLAAARA